MFLKKEKNYTTNYVQIVSAWLMSSEHSRIYGKPGARPEELTKDLHTVKFVSCNYKNTIV